MIETPDGINAEAWDEFEAHRKEIRKPLTDRARALAFKKLLLLSYTDQQQCIEESILNRWTGLFVERYMRTDGNEKSQRVHSGSRRAHNAAVNSYIEQQLSEAYRGATAPRVDAGIDETVQQNLRLQIH